MPSASQMEIAVIRAEMHDIKKDLEELKASNKRLEQFMYKFEGGKAWMFALLGIAATLGAVLSQTLNIFTKH